ncbi:MAG: Crp/Fnr family transcriptional regulator [Alphaproteobacteria bacterium HGW-Alphaproteobacteria-8]|nr:MAG: Crp/Fnr family transcriptional regulator [Alphaproteobacteria bacterium HGW-Alphaproteobacteria-8]
MAAFLARMDLFSTLSPEALTKLAEDFRVRTFHDGELLVERGDASRDFCVLLEGRAIALHMSPTGREIALADLRAGAYFGELSAIDGAPRSVGVHARSPGRLAVLRRSEFTKMLSVQPGIAQRLLAHLAERIRRLSERVYDVSARSVTDRVRLTLARLAVERGQMRDGVVLDPAPTHAEIAAHVDANREAVSRALARLRDHGLITTGRQKITLHDVEALMAQDSAFAGEM